MSKNCTGCMALMRPLFSGVCCLGIRTGTTIAHGVRVRHPLSTCAKPATSARLAEEMETFIRLRRDEV